MKIETKEVRDGKHTGKEVWVCHYLRPDLDKKALRNVPPTKALIKSNDELPKTKRFITQKIILRLSMRMERYWLKLFRQLIILGTEVGQVMSYTYSQKKVNVLLHGMNR